MRREEIRPLTSLRFFAAAAIVAHHSLRTFEISAPRLPLDHAVPFFFVLSGFILTYNYERLAGYRPLTFLISRIARIWPVHLTCLALGFLLLPYFRAQATGPDGAIILLANILMVHDWVPSYRYAFSFNGVSWSISAEMFFYAMFPLLILSRKRMVIGLLLSIAMALTIFYVTRDLTIDQKVPIFERSAFAMWAHLHPTASIGGFILGMLAAAIFRSLHGLAVNTAVATIVECLTVALCIWWFWKGSIALYPHGGTDVARVFYAYNSAFMVAPVIVFVFAWNAGLISRLLSWEPLVLLGRISFSTYMLHQIVIQFAVRQGLIGILGNTIAFLVTIAAVYVGSWLLWRIIEEPMRGRVISALSSLLRRRERVSA